MMLSTINDLIAGTDGNYNLALRVLQLSSFSRPAILDFPLEAICDACQRRLSLLYTRWLT